MRTPQAKKNPTILNAETKHVANAARWLRTLGGTPAQVSQHLEMAHALGFDDLAETLLAPLEPSPPRPAIVPLGKSPIDYPTRHHDTKFPWHFPRRNTRDKCGVRYASEVAAAFALAAGSDVPAAQNLRRMHLFTSRGECWWLADSLERFTSLQTIHAGRWHPDAAVPPRLLCMPAVESLYFDSGLGSAMLERLEWDLPRIRTLTLARSFLTSVPRQILALDTLEVLSLSYNPINTLPEELARLPRLRAIFAWDTNVRVVSAALSARKSLAIHLNAASVPLPYPSAVP